MIPAVIGPALVVVTNRLFAVRAARKRVAAARRDREALALETDKDPTNDTRAKELRLEAEELRAEADALADSKGRSE